MLQFLLLKLKLSSDRTAVDCLQLQNTDIKTHVEESIWVIIQYKTNILCIWSIALYGAENSTPRKLYQKYMGNFEI